jgi:hypothetical protein
MRGLLFGMSVVAVCPAYDGPDHRLLHSGRGAPCVPSPSARSLISEAGLTQPIYGHSCPGCEQGPRAMASRWNKLLAVMILHVV